MGRKQAPRRINVHRRRRIFKAGQKAVTFKRKVAAEAAAKDAGEKS